MNVYGRDGHRSRIREAYLANGGDKMDDVHLVELFLSLIIPRKDVKPIAYSLFNRFDSLEKIFSADYDELVKINGIGKNAAVSIMMYRDLMNRIGDSPSINLYNKEMRLAFVKTDLFGDKKNRIVFVGGDGDCMDKIEFSCFDGAVKNSIVEHIINYNCHSVFVVRYGSENILGEDVNFISEFKMLVNPIGAVFLDYVTVGLDKAVSISDTVHYKLIEK